MNTKDFDKLTQSIKQAGKIKRGNMKASRITNMNPAEHAADGASRRS